MLKNYSKIEVDEFGTKRYFNDEGEHHRLDGPAVESLNGTKVWHINGNHHRNIDISIEYSNRTKFWHFKGKRHRVGGSFSLKYERWFIHDEEYAKKDYYNKVWDI